MYDRGSGCTMFLHFESRTNPALAVHLAMLSVLCWVGEELSTTSLSFFLLRLYSPRLVMRQTDDCNECCIGLGTQHTLLHQYHLFHPHRLWLCDSVLPNFKHIYLKIRFFIHTSSSRYTYLHQLLTDHICFDLIRKELGALQCGVHNSISTGTFYLGSTQMIRVEKILSRLGALWEFCSKLEKTWMCIRTWNIKFNIWQVWINISVFLFEKKKKTLKHISDYIRFLNQKFLKFFDIW